LGKEERIPNIEAVPTIIFETNSALYKSRKKNERHHARIKKITKRIAFRRRGKMRQVHRSTI
jgi:hypothetical protein